MKYLTIKAFSAQSGYTEAAIRQKMQRGDWVEGKQFMKAPDGRMLINVEEYEKWVEESRVVQVRQSKSRLHTAVSDAVKRCRLSPRLQT